MFCKVTTFRRSQVIQKEYSIFVDVFPWTPITTNPNIINDESLRVTVRDDLQKQEQESSSF